MDMNTDNTKSVNTTSKDRQVCCQILALINK